MPPSATLTSRETPVADNIDMATITWSHHSTGRHPEGLRSGHLAAAPGPGGDAYPVGGAQLALDVRDVRFDGA